MIVVRMLLNSWATLLASAPTLLSFWACNSCCRSWSVSLLEAVTSSPIMASRLLVCPSVFAAGRVAGADRWDSRNRERSVRPRVVIGDARGGLHRKSLRNQQLSARLRVVARAEGVAASRR